MGGVFHQLLFGVLEMDFGAGEEIGLVLLEMHLLGAADEPDVVEIAGVAEVEAALLFGERGDVGAGDDGETDEGEEASGCNFCWCVALPKVAEDCERDDAEEGEDEGEGFGEIGEAERDAHQGCVTKMRGGEVAEQGGDGEEKEGEKKSVGADFAHAEFALGGDEEDRDAEVAESVAVEEEGQGPGGGGFAELAEVGEGVGEGDDGEHLEEKDAEVDHVVGVELVVAGRVEEDVADGEGCWVEGVPVAVDDAGPVVGAHEVADVHVSDGVTVDLVSVVEGVAEGDEGCEEAVEGPESAEPIRETIGRRRDVGHAGSFSCVVLLPSSQMSR